MSSGSAFRAIRAIDYAVLFVREMAAMRRFYEDILGFPPLRELSAGWIEQRPPAAPRFFRDPDGNLLEIFADV